MLHRSGWKVHRSYTRLGYALMATRTPVEAAP